jgi:hypothetical protein
MLRVLMLRVLMLRDSMPKSFQSRAFGFACAPPFALRSSVQPYPSYELPVRRHGSCSRRRDSSRSSGPAGKERRWMWSACFLVPEPA